PLREDLRANRPDGLLKRHLLALLQTPDQYWGWYPPAMREGTRLIREERTAAILSTGPPWLSHLVARRLKKKYRIPWLADFRDPWANNPFMAHPIGWERKLKQRLEAACVESADRVICSTERLQEFLAKAHPAQPREKFVVLPNGFDDAAPSSAPLANPQAGSRRVFLHLGSLYVQRRVDTFCAAIRLLAAAGRLQASAFQVLFLGDADPSLVSAARRSAPELFADRSIEFRPRIEWHEAQTRMWQADYLLLFQGGLRLEVPAKFFEYLPTGKPMMAIAKPGALTDIVQTTGRGVSADPDSVDEICRGLERLLKWPVLTPEEVRRQWHSHYHYQNLTTRLAGWIRDLVKA
ncbi:MAG: glycosyltransferase, partial [Verrucomicrobiales bacterium]|nr:glycosyltransferase [Verrucomicrobiales bacterium]